MSLAHTSFKFQQQCNRSQEILQACLKHSENDDIKISEESVPESCSTDSNQNESGQCDTIADENEEVKPTVKNEDNGEAVPQPIKKERVVFNYYIKANGEKVYCCNLCSKGYKYSSSLKIHMRTHTQEKPYVCSICGKNFKQYGSLTYHHRSHTGEQPYACQICGKRYRQSGSLTAHMRIHTGQRPFLCSVCGRGFR